MQRLIPVRKDKRPIQIRRSALKWLLERVQHRLLDSNNPAALQAELDHYDIPLELDVQKDVLANLPELVKRSMNLIEYTGQIDYDEMNWLPHLWNCGPTSEQYEWLFVDEAQDLNTAQLNIVEKVT